MKIEKMQKELARYGLEAFYISNPLDIFYLIGIELSTGVLLVDKKSAQLFVDGRYRQVAEELSIASFPLDTLDKRMQQLSSIGFDEAETTFKEIRMLQDKKVHLLPLDSFVKKIRMVKEIDEIEIIKKSAALLQEGFFYLTNRLKEGMEELEVEFEFGSYLKQIQCTEAFRPIIAFGENAAKPHHKNSKRKLKKGDVVLLDMGVCYEHYHSDMTRCFGFGKVEDEVEKMYALVYEAKKRAIDSLSKGKKCQDIDKVARGFLEKEGFGEFFIHSLGHGIGLETHELPILKKQNEEMLVANSVVTIEPGLYFPKRFGIRIEDMIWVKNEGFEKSYSAIKF